MKKLLDDEGNELKDSILGNRFMVAKAGDHCMVPFQCELCHFRNFTDRNPWNFTGQDDELMCFARRENLDAFWSREPPTTRKNLRECLRMDKSAKRFGYRYVVPPMGPFPLEDTVGITATFAILD